MRGQREFAPKLTVGGQRLRGGEGAQHRLLIVEESDHPAAQVVIKFNAEIGALDLRRGGGDFRCCDD